MTTKTETVVNVLLHVLILFTILTLIFWFVIRKVEAQSITDELNNNINTYLDHYKDSSVLQRLVKDNSSELEVLNNMYSKPEPVTEMNNKWLLQTNILYVVILFVILLSILFTIRFVYNTTDFPILQIIKENMVIFLFIGAVEIWFFLNIGTKFIPTKPSMLIENIRKDLIAKL
jgi:hypothetical protein